MGNKSTEGASWFSCYHNQLYPGHVSGMNLHWLHWVQLLLFTLFKCSLLSLDLVWDTLPTKKSDKSHFVCQFEYVISVIILYKAETHFSGSISLCINQCEPISTFHVVVDCGRNPYQMTNNMQSIPLNLCLY